MLFAKGLVAEIVARAAASDHEVCGLLLGEDDRVTAAFHCRNVAADPATGFEIDPAQLIAAHRAARAGGPGVIGCYHSHPGGDATPSRRDAADAMPSGWLWVIAIGSGAGVFRAVGNGRWHGRFDAVTWTSAD